MDANNELLQAISQMMDEKLSAEREHTSQMMDEKLSAEREHTSQMMDEKLSAEREHTSQMMDEKLSAERERTSQMMDEKLSAERERTSQMMDEKLSAERERTSQMMDEMMDNKLSAALGPIRADIADLKQGQADLKESVQVVRTSQMKTELEQFPRIAAALDGIKGLQEKYDKLDRMEAKQEDHGNRILALEFTVQANRNAAL